MKKYLALVFLNLVLLAAVFYLVNGEIEKKLLDVSKHTADLQAGKKTIEVSPPTRLDPTKPNCPCPVCGCCGQCGRRVGMWTLTHLDDKHVTIQREGCVVDVPRKEFDRVYGKAWASPLSPLSPRKPHKPPKDHGESD